jgi:hypothetical protein
MRYIILFCEMYYWKRSRLWWAANHLENWKGGISNIDGEARRRQGVDVWAAIGPGKARSTNCLI